MENIVMIKSRVAGDGHQKWGQLPMARILNYIVGCCYSGKNLVIRKHACYLNLQSLCNFDS
jgi:hypothetical protein